MAFDEMFSSGSYRELMPGIRHVFLFGMARIPQIANLFAPTAHQIPVSKGPDQMTVS
jgi:hypothetical protein